MGIIIVFRNLLPSLPICDPQNLSFQSTSVIITVATKSTFKVTNATKKILMFGVIFSKRMRL